MYNLLNIDIIIRARYISQLEILHSKYLIHIIKTAITRIKCTKNEIENFTTLNYINYKMCFVD